MKIGPLHELRVGVLLFAVSLSGLGAQAWAQGTTPMPPGSDVSEKDSGGADAQTMKDKIFVRKSTQGGLAEVQLGQLALQKTSNEDVKKFAQRMVDDHTMLNENMKPVATSMGLKLPTAPDKMDQAEIARLSALSGSDFDKEYLTLMSKDHRKDMKEFEEEATSAADPTLKEVVTNGLKVIVRHSRMADRMAAANGATVAPPAK